MGGLWWQRGCRQALVRARCSSCPHASRLPLTPPLPPPPLTSPHRRRGIVCERTLRSGRTVLALIDPDMRQHWQVGTYDSVLSRLLSVLQSSLWLVGPTGHARSPQRPLNVFACCAVLCSAPPRSFLFIRCGVLPHRRLLEGAGECLRNPEAACHPLQSLQPRRFAGAQLARRGARRRLPPVHRERPPRARTHLPGPLVRARGRDG